MIIDFSAKVPGLDGKPAEENATLRDIVVQALIGTIESDGRDGKAKFERGELARKIHNSEVPIEVSLDERKTIKDRIGAIFPTIIVLGTWPMLEG